MGEIYETIPMIFSGENEEALKKMMTLYETIHDRYTDHPDYDVLLNSIGLAFQRGYQDLSRALEWYTKSLKQRSLLVRINPQSMLVTLNNIAMIRLRTGDL
uniref:Prolyl 4-hydroxylase alpha-subunit N-terminal domain-containing protein n=1 Tax=Biomphalaria glabrata TaxID=6526 RepID=A0A2C9LXK5_BIOGL